MAALPITNLPGHQRLRERVWAALDRCQETRDVEFKETAPWEILRLKIVKTAMAMANLRDGGIILIGASERGNTWSLDGIDAEHLATYDPDAVLAVVNKYASPHVELEVVPVEDREGRQFLAIEVQEFDVSPVICKKAYGSDWHAGDIFVRPVGQPRSSRPSDSKDIEELLALAAEKRASRIIQTAKHIGLEAQDTDQDRFADEQAKMEINREVTKLDGVPRWRIIIRPSTYDATRITTISELWRIVEGVRIRRRGSDYPVLLRPDEYRGQGTDWVGAWYDSSDEPQDWKLFQSGQFVHDLGIRGSTGSSRDVHEEWARHHLSYLNNFDWEQVKGYVGIILTIRTLTLMVEFASRLCQKGIIEGRCNVIVSMVDIKGTMLVTDPRRAWHEPCIANENRLSHHWQYPVDELVADPVTPPVEMATWFFERFGWLDPSPEVIRKDVEAFRRGE